MDKRSIQQGDIIIVNIHTPNTGPPKYIKQISFDIKGDKDINTLIVGDFKTPFPKWTDHSGRKSAKKHLS